MLSSAQPSRGRDDQLFAEIEAGGYFPGLIAQTVRQTLGEEPIEAWCLHLEPTFTGEEIHRHLTVLALTPSRIVLVHADEGPDGQGESQAIISAESIALRAVNAVALTQVVGSPEGAGSCREAWLNVGWGTMSRLELEPASCDDPQCTADHGFTGSLSREDLTLRSSVAADGEAHVAQLIDFGVSLQRITGQRTTGR